MQLVACFECCSAAACTAGCYDTLQPLLTTNGSLLMLTYKDACCCFAVTCVASGTNGVDLVLNCTVNSDLTSNTSW